MGNSASKNKRSNEEEGKRAAEEEAPPPAPTSQPRTTGQQRVLECRASLADGTPEYLVQPGSGGVDKWDSLSGYTGSAIKDFDSSPGAKWTCQHCDTVHQYTLSSCPGCKKSRDTAAVKWEVALAGGKAARLPVIVTAQLEAALKRGDSTVDLWMHNDKRFDYTFDLNAMEQKNLDSNQVRNVKRIPAGKTAAASSSSVRTILERRSSLSDGTPEYLVRPPSGDDRWDSLSGYTGNAIAKFEAATGVQWTCQHCDTVHQYTLSSCPGCNKSRDTAAVAWEVTLGGGKTAKMPVIVCARLEAALKKGDTTVDHWMHNDKRFNYTFDLQAMEQKNNDSNQVRPLKRVPASSSSKSSASSSRRRSTTTAAITILECRPSLADGTPEYLVAPQSGDNKWDSLSGYTGSAIKDFEASPGAKWTCQHCDTVHQFTLASCPGCKKSRDTAAVKWEVALAGGKTARLPVIVTALLEAALKKGDTTVDHWMHNDKRFDYTFDLQAMEQKNKDSNQVRTIKRVPASSSANASASSSASHRRSTTRVVETILEQRTDPSDGKPQYLVRLLGADDDDEETWESLSNYSGSAIADFEASPAAKWTCQFCDTIHQYNKTSCPGCGKSRGDAAVQWTVLLDGGKEAVLSVVVTTLLEEARKNNQTTVDHWMRNPPHNDKFDYTFDVKKMEQLNKKTNVTRSLKRKAVILYVVLDARPASDDGKQLEYLLQKHGEDPSWVAQSTCPGSTIKDFNKSSGAKWSCSSCPHAVMSYTKKQCNACSKARDDCAVKWLVEIDGGNKVPLPVSVSALLDDATRTGKSTCSHWMWTAKKFNYTFDLAKMEQKNLDSGTCRNIHRDPILKHDPAAQALRKQTQVVKMVVSLQGLYRVATEYARTRGFPIPLINPVALTNNAGDKFQAALTKMGYKNINELLNMGKHYTVGFHGTDTADAIVGIFNTGFDPARRGNNGQVHGPGEYFDISTNAGVATQYHGSTKCLIVSIIILLHRDGSKNPLYSESLFCDKKDLPIAIVNNPKSDDVAYQIPVAVVSNCPTTDAVVDAVKKTYADELEEINQYL